MVKKIIYIVKVGVYIALSLLVPDGTTNVYNNAAGLLIHL